MKNNYKITIPMIFNYDSVQSSAVVSTDNVLFSIFTKAQFEYSSSTVRGINSGTPKNSGA